MSIRIVITLFTLVISVSSYGCAISDPYQFMKIQLDSPTLSRNDIEETTYSHEISVVKAKATCGILGCSYTIFEKTTKKCFKLLGTYHGHLKKLKIDIHGYPAFELSFPTGDNIRVYYNPKTKKYTDK